MLQTIFTAILCYPSTNIDDLFLLPLLCAQADSKAGQRSILTGHYLGIGALTAVSLLGAFGLQVSADERLVRLLGLIPILVGIRSLLQTKGDDAPSLSRATLGTSGIFLLPSPTVRTTSASTFPPSAAPLCRSWESPSSSLPCCALSGGCWPNALPPTRCCGESCSSISTSLSRWC